MSYAVRYYVLGEEQTEDGFKSQRLAILWALALWDSMEGLPFAIERGGVPVWRVEHAGDESSGRAMQRRESFERFAYLNGCMSCVPSSAPALVPGN